MSSASRVQTSYAALSSEIRDQGLLDRSYTHYWRRIAVTVLAFLAVCVAVPLLGRSWYQLLVAAALGVVASQAGFLSHEAAHRQIFRSAAWNDWGARLMGSLLAGLSAGWWRSKHNRHHAAPNQEGRDPDIGPGLVAFTRDIADSRRTGLWGWFTGHQGWLLLPLLSLEGLSLHVSSLQSVITSPEMPWRRTETVLIVFRLSAYVGVLVWLLGPGMAAAFVAVQLAVFGVALGGAFVPNHTGMPIVPPGARIDFLERQVLMSRNVRGGRLVDLAMGGLNLQIEHHLFPSMTRPQAKRAQPIVRRFCAERDIPYAEVGVLDAYLTVIDYLNHVGLRARTPYACPLATQLR